MKTNSETKILTNQFKNPMDTIEIITFTAIASIIIAGGAFALIRMSKVMVSDCKEMGI